MASGQGSSTWQVDKEAPDGKWTRKPLAYREANNCPYMSNQGEESRASWPKYLEQIQKVSSEVITTSNIVSFKMKYNSNMVGVHTLALAHGHIHILTYPMIAKANSSIGSNGNSCRRFVLNSAVIVSEIKKTST